MSAQEPSLPTDFGTRFALIMRILAGDREAIQFYFDCYVAKFRRIIRETLDERVRPLEDSVTLLQEARAALLERPLPDYVKTSGALVGYICGLVRNLALLSNRRHLECPKRSRLREVALEDVVQQREEPASRPESAEQDEEAMERGYRELLKQVRAGTSLKQIADRADVSLTLVREWYKNALKMEERQAKKDGPARKKDGEKKQPE